MAQKLSRGETKVLGEDLTRNPAFVDMLKRAAAHSSTMAGFDFDAITRTVVASLFPPDPVPIVDGVLLVRAGDGQDAPRAQFHLHVDFGSVNFIAPWDNRFKGELVPDDFRQPLAAAVRESHGDRRAGNLGHGRDSGDDSTARAGAHFAGGGAGAPGGGIEPPGASDTAGATQAPRRAPTRPVRVNPRAVGPVVGNRGPAAPR